MLILATGFKVFEQGNMPPFPVTGRDGVDLEGWWMENRLQAYEGASVPGFPNMFSILGPYAYNGSSYFNLIETQRPPHRALPQARAARRRHAGGSPQGGQRPLLPGDARAAASNQIFFQPAA